MRYGINPNLSRALRIIAGQLPMVNQETCEKHRLTGAEVLEETEIREFEGKPIDPKEVYIMPMPVLIAANHYRRLKKAWKRAGRDGVQHYMRRIEKIKIEQEKQTT